jgi:hypothetical protein
MRKTTLVAVVVAILLAIPATLYASHQFADVPNTHTFHEAITWMADNGITQGCNPPANTNYCPENSVTRGQMAGFMKRFYDNLVAGGGTGLGVALRPDTATPDNGNGVVEGLAMNLRIPQPGALVVTGSLQVANLVDLDALACGINPGSAPSTAISNSWRFIDLTTASLGSCDTITAIAVDPGNQVVRIVVSGALATTEALQGGLSAVLYTVDGAFGLLSDANDVTESRTLSDIPKSAGTTE